MDPVQCRDVGRRQSGESEESKRYSCFGNENGCTVCLCAFVYVWASIYEYKCVCMCVCMYVCVWGGGGMREG